MPTITKPLKKTRLDRNIYHEERARVYRTARWRRLREMKLMHDPLCELCLEEGRTTPAEDVHHITSFMSVTDPTQRQFLAYDYNNLQSLCKVCHQRTHNAKGYGKI